MTFGTIFRYFKSFPAYEVRRMAARKAGYIFQYRYAIFMDKKDKGLVSLELFTSEEDAILAVNKRIKELRP